MTDYAAISPQIEAPFVVGKKYLIRTVTMYSVGELIWAGDKELVLRNCSWIPDCGKWHECLKTGNLTSYEPFPNDAIIGRGAIIDATEWNFDLFSTPKE